MKNKKLFAILTLVCFLFTLMPVAAFATGEETTPTVYIAGTAYTEALMEAGTVTTPSGVSIDWDNKTITLNGANIEWNLSDGIDENATGVFSTAIGGVAVIWIDDEQNGWTMNVIGENMLKLILNDFGENGRTFDVAEGKAIFCESGLTISGNGENAKLDISEKVFGYVSSIDVFGDLTIKNVAIDIDNDFNTVGEYTADDFESLSTTVLSSTETLNIEGAGIDIDSEFFHGWCIYSGDETTIKDSDVNINGNKIQTGVGTAKGLTIIGEETSVVIECLSIGIGSTTTITDAEVIITVNSTSAYDTKTGIYSASGEININSGTVAIESTGTGLGTYKGDIEVAAGEITVEAPVAVSANKEASIELSTGSYTGSISTGTDSTVSISGENTTITGDITMAGVSDKDGAASSLTITDGATVSGTVSTSTGAMVQTKNESTGEIVYTSYKDVDSAKEAAKEAAEEGKKVEEVTVATPSTGGEGDSDEPAVEVVEYTVTFITNGGTDVAGQTVGYYQKAAEPDAPTKDGFTFAGWFTSEDDGTTLSETAYDFAIPVEENITLYAKWEENHVHDYTVTEYDENGHWTKCACGDTTEAAAHVFGDWTVTKEATTSETGEKERACDCGYKETDEIAKLTPSYTGGYYTPSTFTDAEVTSPNEDVKLTAKAISTSTLNDAKDAVEEDENATVIGGKDSAVQIVAKEDGKALDSFVQPVTVTVPVSKSALKDVENVNNLTLALVTEDENGNTALTYVGGNYDAQEGTFTAYTNQPGNYVLVEKSDIVKIDMFIGNTTSMINGEAVTNDVAAYIANDRTMVPAAFIMDQLGCKVDWFGDERKVVITLPDGSQLSMIIDQEIPGFGAVPVIKDDRTMVPIAYIADAMGAHVLWVGDEYRVVIVK